MRALEPGDPTQIGKYRLLGVVGTGGMGRVYLGRSDTGRTVAVKVIRPDLADDENFRARFGHEVSSARRVSGQFTAAVLDADVTAPQPWLATAFVAGLSLTDAARTFGNLPDDSVIFLADGLAKAIQAVHAAGVVHRDLKPSNVILGLDGPRVIDFGIARAVDDSILTASGQVVGSPSFMSPEQVKGEKTSPKSDVFALGGVIVYAASGVGPFGEGDTMTLLWRVVQEEPDLGNVPDSVRPIVAACLQKNPADRPSIDEVIELLAPLRPSNSSWLPPAMLEDVGRRTATMLDLEPTESTETFASTPPPTPAPAKATARRKAPALVAGSILALIAIGSAVWFLTRGSSDGEDSGSTSESSAVGVGGLPSSFDGMWTGTTTGPAGEYAVEMYLYWGDVGDTVGTTTYTKPNGDTCVRNEDMTAVDDRTVQLSARPQEGPSSCLDDEITSTITLDSVSALTYSSGGQSGTLTRQ